MPVAKPQVKPTEKPRGCYSLRRDGWLRSGRSVMAVACQAQSQCLEEVALEDKLPKRYSRRQASPMREFIQS